MPQASAARCDHTPKQLVLMEAFMFAEVSSEATSPSDRVSGSSNHHCCGRLRYSRGSTHISLLRPVCPDEVVMATVVRAKMAADGELPSSM